jgi:Excalibur calcium-binding domain
MKKLLVIALIGFLAWKGYDKFHGDAETATPVRATPLAQPFGDAAPSGFKCDGRTRCGQMSSCEEATYFIKNCPNTQMDGNNDGVPCEQQWCH